jgi:hypothetical protein
VGKTTWFASFPDAFFLATEPGTKGLELYEEEVKDWADVRVVVRALEKDTDRFRIVVIDTADEAYQMCLDWVCKKKGVTYPSEMNDYGATWNEVSREFRNVISRIRRTGRGVVFTSHARTVNLASRSGQEFQRIGPTLSGQAEKTITSLVDFIMYAEYFKDLKTGETVRVLVCEGDETIQAGARKTVGKFPRFLPLQETGGYNTYVRAFKGEHKGIDPKRLIPSNRTSKVGSGFLQKSKRERAKAMMEQTAPERKKT